MKWASHKGHILKIPFTLNIHIENSIYIKYPDKKIHEDKVSWWLSGREWEWELMRRGFLLQVIKCSLQRSYKMVWVAQFWIY